MWFVNGKLNIKRYSQIKTCANNYDNQMQQTPVGRIYKSMTGHCFFKNACYSVVSNLLLQSCLLAWLFIIFGLSFKPVKNKLLKVLSPQPRIWKVKQNMLAFNCNNWTCSCKITLVHLFLTFLKQASNRLVGKKKIGADGIACRKPWCSICWRLKFKLIEYLIQTS